MGRAATQLTQDSVEALIGEREWIAPRQQNIVNALIVRDVVYGRLNFVLVNRPRRLLDHALSGTEAAQSGTSVGHQKQDSPRVTVDDAGPGNGVALLTKLIQHRCKSRLGFLMECR